LLWWLIDGPKLGPAARDFIADPANAVIVLAERYGFHIVKDDPFADLLPARSPRLAQGRDRGDRLDGASPQLAITLFHEIAD